MFGALQVGGEGAAELVNCPTVNLESSRTFLHQIAAREPDTTHVVLWDGAGFHPGDGDPGIPANVRLIAWPPYRPELNPVEKLWDQLNDHLCNRVFATLASLETVLSEFLRAFWQDGRRVLSLSATAGSLKPDDFSANIIPEGVVKWYKA